MADVELLPCPFCGVAAAEVGGLVPWAQCLACDATGPQRESEADAVAAWNHRAAAAAKDAKIEALRRMVQERDNMLGRKPCAGMNADGNPRCIEMVLQRARAERMSAAVEADLRELARGSTPDGDGVPVNVMLWAELRLAELQALVKDLSPNQDDTREARG